MSHIEQGQIVFSLFVLTIALALTVKFAFDWMTAKLKARRRRNLPDAETIAKEEP